MLSKINSKQCKQLKPYQGIGVFILVIMVTIFVAAPIQMVFGMYGVAITEIILLLLAIIPAILFKANFKEVFPIKKPLLREIFGVLLIWAGSYVAVLLVTLIIGYFFPQGLTDVSSGLQNVFTSVPMWVAFIIIAVMPAICEEALHRGLILSSLGSVNNKWLRVLYMGIIFGIFHLDPVRFLPTAILGMALSYVMIETRNIILPVIFHFVNNGLATLISFTSKSQTTAANINSGMMLYAISTYFIIGAVVPFLLLFGSKLIHKKQARNEVEDDAITQKKEKKIMIIAGICSGLMVVLGIVVMVYAISTVPITDVIKH
ncbi:membrane protease YdiL (CAAX protease family) [Clostridium punense]|uniref:Membrane protease YdiL (CAAX protease family) n=1 Tax=Clostridium punense TaxID=1054297 RepID=A0ABS4JYQ7_9CLOT|nr:MULTISPECIES: type II CAAX endopeptidase family protein [Clostridium]EQB87603.1 hypothetical protein M918_08300 [Clostridium sp. BL8]MBP2020675.1 membrane protease YdiL (CAAX protease family) [Clostridium punense]